VKFVFKEAKLHNPTVVDLTEDILVYTDIPQDYHAALRSGFAGYPANPRWTVGKFHAWKTGRQLRGNLAQGQMVVRTTDSMLISVHELKHSEVEPSENRLWCHVPLWAKQILNSSPAM
jgi:hypothetical protein